MYDELNGSLLSFLSSNLGWTDLNSIQKKLFQVFWMEMIR